MTEADRQDDGSRLERDSLGSMRVPEEALYGPQTARAAENFPVSGLRFPRGFLRMLGLIKKHAARVNAAGGRLEASFAQAIERAADEVARGDHDSQFVVDVFQTGSGTSTNMNANEVIARLASRTLAQSGASGPIHPNDHVNLSQSSNDVIPTALHLAALEGITNELLPALEVLESALRRKADEFQGVVKTGRTHLQDAVPLRLGQEFGGYARQVAQARGRLRDAIPGLAELPLGGTAVGNGLNAWPGFAERTIAALAEETGLPLREAEDHFEAQAARDAVVHASGALRTTAVSLTKIANDIRWLGSGPRCGLGELSIPAVQPGSSIMPGKINPVMAEMLLQAAAQVIGNDAAIGYAGSAGNFELNVMMPVMAHNLLQSIELLARASDLFARRCVEGLSANRERCEELVERSLASVTALAPRIGYDKAAEIAHAAHESGRSLRETAREQLQAGDDELAEWLDPKRLAL